MAGAGGHRPLRARPSSSSPLRRQGLGLLALVLGAVLLLATQARAEEQKKKTVAWGQSAVYMKGKWVAFDEADEAGVPQPYPPKTDSWKGNDTSIMVSISSFRDYRCAKTLYNLFTYVVSRGAGLGLGADVSARHTHTPGPRFKPGRTHTTHPPHPTNILHSKATNPDRVYVGVVQQNNEGDVDCLHDYCRIIKDEKDIRPKVRAR